MDQASRVVSVNPPPQAGPFLEQRVMSDRDGIELVGQQPGPGEGIDDCFRLGRSAAAPR